MNSLGSRVNGRQKAETDFFRPVFCILGLPFDAMSEAQVVDVVLEAAVRGHRCFFSTPNLNFLIGSLSDPAFRDSVIRSDLSVPDGMPIVWVARMLGLPVRERVAGSSMFDALCHTATPPRVYFFGGPPGVAEIASTRLNSAAHGARCVGFSSPGFGTVEQMSSDETIASINDCAPQLLVVAIGAKKGQAWIEHNLARLQVPAISYLGAVVNFVAGTVQRAPGWVGGLGLEWLWRIKKEPALWRRYWADGRAFLGLLATRVLPLMWRRFHKVPAELLSGTPTVAVQHTSDGVRLRMGGCWHAGNMVPLREAFSLAAGHESNLRLQLDQLEYVDSAVIALILLLFGHQSKLRMGWQVDGVGPSLRRQFYLHGADYVLDEPCTAGVRMA